MIMYYVVHRQSKELIAVAKTKREAEDEVIYGEDMMREAGLFEEGMFEIVEEENDDARL